MSIFKHHETSADRSASDRQRHKKKIEKAIREGIHDVVAEESIIGQDGKKKIKIPVKGIKEWQFVFGSNTDNKQAGSAPGTDIQKGQVIKKGDPQQGGGAGKKASSDKGEEFYEVEVTLEELASYLFDSLGLPDLDKKKLKEIKDVQTKRHGHRPHGIPPRLDKRESMKNRLRRKAAAKRSGEIEIDPETGEEVFPFHDDDLSYHHIQDKPKESTSAVIFFMMDVSGSMTKDIKFIARSFYFLLYQFIRHKYDAVKIVFIGHTTEAFETDEDSFFNRGASGGTFVSTAPTLAMNIINQRFHPSSWNIYAFHCTDGDNWPEDETKSINAFKALSEVSQMTCYCEILPSENRIAWDPEHSGTLMKSLRPLDDGKKFRTISLYSEKDIWPMFNKLFGGSQ
jgi:sporulation protein YhbH